MRAQASDPSFDPAGAVRFDLDRGCIQLSDDEPQLLMPASVVVALASGSLSSREVGRILGGKLLARIAARLREHDEATTGGSDTLARLREADLETVVDWLGGELALLGLGSLTIERWGRALVLSVEPCTLDARGDELLEGLVEAALGSLCDEDLGAVVAERGGAVRLLVVHASLVDRLRAELARGAGLAELVHGLHAQGAHHGVGQPSAVERRE